jgi:hypothetical protein
MFAIILLKLRLQQILSDIPHDLPALVAYAILVLFVLGIWLGSRSRPGQAGPVADERVEPYS